MTHPVENDRTCPACGARVGEPCDVPIGGVNTAGWTHDARILAPVIADLSTRPIPPGMPNAETPCGYAPATCRKYGGCDAECRGLTRPIPPAERDT